MFCHRKNSHKPNSSLIGRFQSLYGKAMIKRPADSDDTKIQSSEGQMTPSQGASKRAKGNLEGANDFYLFDGYGPTETFQSLITEQWLTPQSHDACHIPSQFKNPTALQDPNDISQSSKNLPQNLPRTDDTGSMMGPHSENQSNSQVDSNFQSVNPSHSGMSIDPVAPQNIMTPNEFSNQGSYPGYMGHATQSSNDAQLSSNHQIPWTAGEKTKDDVFTRSQSIKFRYQTILQASTAMINNPDDSPVSYLNKGQVYQLTVEDTSSTKVDTRSNQYQTFIRISFDEDQQRSDPAAFWQLWRSGRASKEFKKDDGEPKAIKYAGQNNSLMQLETETYDGFSVTWNKNPGDGVSRCSIPICFNFLSTDFTISKGVKGMQIRLCAKTKQLWDISLQENETVFCNVKLFRDHGAERKLANDAMSIRRRIEKLKMQLNEPAPPDPMIKRKRSSVSSKSKPNDSLSEQDLSNSQYRTNYQNQLQRRLKAMQISLQSCLPENSLDLRAAKEDDPELHPTLYLHSSQDEEVGNDYRRSSSSEKGANQTSDSVEKDMPGVFTATRNVDEAFDDALSTLDQSAGPAACFYIKLCRNNEPSNEYYRAIYTRGRTVDDLKLSISHKISLDPADIAHILYITPAGLKVAVDDEFVQEIDEGQSMILRVIDILTENLSNGGKYEIRLEY